jgi:hypothetical protein
MMLKDVACGERQDGEKYRRARLANLIWINVSPAFRLYPREQHQQLSSAMFTKRRHIEPSRLSEEGLFHITDVVILVASVALIAGVSISLLGVF